MAVVYRFFLIKERTLKNRVHLLYQKEASYARILPISLFMKYKQDYSAFFDGYQFSIQIGYNDKTKPSEYAYFW